MKKYLKKKIDNKRERKERGKMKTKYVLTACVFIILLLFPIIAGATTVEDNERDSMPLYMFRIFGFFPQVDNDTITYLAFPWFYWRTIPKDDFVGYIGVIIIKGYFNPSPYIENN